METVRGRMYGWMYWWMEEWMDWAGVNSRIDIDHWWFCRNLLLTICTHWNWTWWYVTGTRCMRGQVWRHDDVIIWRGRRVRWMGGNQLWNQWPKWLWDLCKDIYTIFEGENQIKLILRKVKETYIQINKYTGYRLWQDTLQGRTTPFFVVDPSIFILA